MFPRKFAAMPLLLVIACLGGCGDDEGGTHGPGATYTVGGRLSGLAIGDSITLRNNGADDLTLTANGGLRSVSPSRTVRPMTSPCWRRPPIMGAP
ncbi:MAG: hypothetical protein IPG61_16855 [bacterium]|nr:hypothetical protein [bacterium]